MADLGYGGCAVFLACVGVGLPLRDEGGVGVGVGVFGVEGWVEGASEVVDVDLDVALRFGQCWCLCL